MTEQVAEHWVAATFHGRTLSTPGRADRALIGFHGYGENAERGLAALAALTAARDWTRVAVQAPHPFYERRSEEVVANWMTRQGRDHALRDNVEYVRRSVEAVLGTGRPPAGRRAVAVGFSQGVAMAYRAVAGGAFAASGLIALGGDLPPELPGEVLAALPPVLIGRGRAEAWYTPEKLAADTARLLSAGVAVEVVEFEGGHEWTDEFRQHAGRFLERLA